MGRTVIKSTKVEASIDAAGAQLVSLKRDGGEYLWQGDSRWWSGQAPVLFPIVGNLRGDRAQSQAGEVQLPRHGLARRREFELVEADDSSVRYQLLSDEETRASYPYHFSFTMAYSLLGDTLEQRFIVTNTGKDPLPYVVGGHPAFNVPAPGDDADFSDYVLKFTRPWTYASPTLEIDTGLWDFANRQPLLSESDTFSFTHRTFDVDTLVFEDVPQRSVSLIGPSGHGVRVDFDGFDYLGVWSAAGDAPFVAIEPWCGPATAFDEDDIFEHKRGMDVLKPDQTAEYAFTITPL